VTLRPAIYDRNVFVLDETDFVQAIVKRSNGVGVGVRCIWIEKPDHRHCRLLRARSERPRRRRAAEQRDDFAPFHEFSRKPTITDHV
jgi:hypothetical protein